MKNLILVRHGKSSWDQPLDDRQRPLIERGVNDAGNVGAAFKKNMPNIDRAFSSPATRALHTCKIFLKAINFPIEKIQVTEELYDFTGNRVMAFIRSLEDSVETVIIFGHNHAFTEVANEWGNVGIDNVPTAGLVHLQFSANRWHDIQQGTTARTLFPKELDT